MTHPSSSGRLLKLGKPKRRRRKRKSRRESEQPLLTDTEEEGFPRQLPDTEQPLAIADASPGGANGGSQPGSPVGDNNKVIRGEPSPTKARRRRRKSDREDMDVMEEDSPFVLDPEKEKKAARRIVSDAVGELKVGESAEFRDRSGSSFMT